MNSSVPNIQWSRLSFWGSKYNFESLEETMALLGRLWSLKPWILHCLSLCLNNKHRSYVGYNMFVSSDSIKIPWDKETGVKLEGQLESAADDNVLESLGLWPPSL